ncbi:tripartite tricarboxylate transporter permease [Candidatus Woesearchaeota archaeon]|nr:tripartite tricarboxylate transporter permease [Candidatus Woesearchaeota archaeon]
MFIELLLTTVVGISIGIITGLTPGIHINLVSVILLSFAPFLLNYLSPLSLAAFIAAVAVTHTFLDAVPSIYLGAPDEEKALTVLPGHRLLLKGLGHLAIMYTLIGALGAIILAVILTPAFIIIMQYSYKSVSKITAYLLIVVIIFMILKEPSIKKKFLAFIFFTASGILGLLILQNKTINQPLFLLLSGLFGLSILLESITQESNIPKQQLDADIPINKTITTKAITSSTLVGFIAAFLPGFGSSQAAILAVQIVGNIGDAGFLILVGGISTANTMISLVSSYTIEKARSGAIVAINQLIGVISLQIMFILLIVSLIAGSIAVIVTIKISKLFCILLQKVNYRKIAISIMIFILLLTVYFDSFVGIIILATSTSLGIIASRFGVGKNHLMGCLILPVILFFMI